MKKLFIGFLVLLNIVILFGLLGLVGYQFTEIVKRNSEVEQLKGDLEQARLKQKQISESGSISKPTQTIPEKPIPQNSELAISVFYSKAPENELDFTAVVEQKRTTTRADLETFALEEIMKGPSSPEKTQGAQNPIALSGSSNCSDKDFSLDITLKKATMKFCKTVVSNGIGDDARIKTVIEKTLSQFDTIDSVLILTKDGSCFGDQSGQNSCKK
jgi:hypothetical protein